VGSSPIARLIYVLVVVAKFKDIKIDKTAALCLLYQCSILRKRGSANAELDLAVRESMAKSGEEAENMPSE
jgi:hypothetical protein